jgi:PKD domain
VVEHKYEDAGRFELTLRTDKHMEAFSRSVGVVDCSSYSSAGDIEVMDLHKSQPRTAYLFACLEDSEQQRQYRWHYGDGETSNQVNDFLYVTQHTWAQNGDYIVQLSVVTLTVEGNTEDQFMGVIRVGRLFFFFFVFPVQSCPTSWRYI